MSASTLLESAHKSLVNQCKVISELYGMTVFIQACKKAAIVAYTFYVHYFKMPNLWFM